MNKKIVLLAKDAAPSGAFKLLEPALKALGFHVTVIVSNGKPMHITENEVRGHVKDADILLLGMSFPAENAQMEIFAGSVAKLLGIPYGFYGDVPGCFARASKGEAFEPLAEDASFYFGITESDALKARAIFPKARLLGFGNPLREAMAFPQFSREEVRAKLGASEDEKVILVPGGKCIAANMATCIAVIDALSEMSDGGRGHTVIFTAHPGDRAIDATGPDGKALNLYEELADLSPFPMKIIHKDTLCTSDVVPGADLIVEFGSSVGIEGGYQNIPVITLGFEVLFVRNKRLSGVRTPEATRDGLSAATDPSGLAKTMRELLTKEGFAPLAMRQKEICPKPKERYEAVSAIARALMAVVM